MTKKVKEHVALHYLLTKIQLYFDYFGVEYIPLESLNKIRNKSITHNVFRIQANGSIKCGFYFIDFVEYMLSGKNLLDYANLFSPNDYKNWQYNI